MDPCALGTFCKECAKVPEVKQKKVQHRALAGTVGAAKRMESIRNKKQQDKGQYARVLPQHQQVQEPYQESHQQQQAQQQHAGLASQGLSATSSRSSSSSSSSKLV
jgi:hypothetical protein